MSTIPMSNTQNNKGLNIGLWIVQGLLAAMFIMAGVMKLTTPIEEMAEKAAWVNEFPALLRFIGAAELAGGLGLLLPSILRIKPVLTPVAALGIIIIMVLAAVFHAMHAEYPGIATCVVIGLLATFIAWGRFKKVPISAK